MDSAAHLSITMSCCTFTRKPPLQQTPQFSLLQQQPWAQQKVAARQAYTTHRPHGQPTRDAQAGKAFLPTHGDQQQQMRQLHMHSSGGGNYASTEQLELTEENIEIVLADARVELMQMFDESVGMTGDAMHMMTCLCWSLTAKGTVAVSYLHSS